MLRRQSCYYTLSRDAFLKALRTRNPSSLLETSVPYVQTDKKLRSNTAIRDAVRDMMDHGWTREKSDVKNFKSGLWKRLAERILRDLYVNYIILKVSSVDPTISR